MQPLGKQWLTVFAYMHYISNGEGNGTPLQYSCLENPMDWGAWWLHWGRKESDTTERLHFHFSLSCTGEGNGNPLQCSCLENPRDGGAWWAAVYGVTQSQMRLKWLSSSSRSNYISKPRKQGHRLPEYFVRHIKTQKVAQEINKDLRYTIISGIL